MSTNLTAQFRDGSTGPVSDVHWSPEFMTGLAHRGDGKVRCVFFGRRNGAMLQEDPWILRLVEVKPTIELVA